MRVRKGSGKPLQVLICPDKFKGSISAARAAAAIRRGWLSRRPQDEVVLLPISDGGDGFGELLGNHLNAVAVQTRSVDASHRARRVKWWWEPRTRTAIIESARAIGLAMLPKGAFHPFELDTSGLAAVLRAAAAKQPKRCIIGVGGSATNDGGFGMAIGLGWGFEDNRGNRVQTWTKLCDATKLVSPAAQLDLGETIVAVDVANPLLGPLGCSRIYGPQKGLKPRDFKTAEKSLKRLAELVAAHMGRDIAALPGAGAAGGLGFGLVAFCGAEIKPGFELFAEMTRLGQLLSNADIVVTGEGSVDDSTFMGKGVGTLRELCARREIPCVAIGGRVAPSASSRFRGAISLTDLVGEEMALGQPAYSLMCAGRRLSELPAGRGLRQDAHCAKVSQ